MSLILPRKKHAAVIMALDAWVASGDLDETTASHLKEITMPLAFDWHRLGRYILWTALASLFIGVMALSNVQALRDLYMELWSMTPLAPALILTLIAALLYYWGARRRMTQPYRWFTNEGILFVAVIVTAGSIAQLGRALDTGSGHFSLLLGLATLVYGAIGLWLNSKLVWIFALLSLGSWMGAETGYASGWGAYWMGMNYPMRFVLFGGILIAAASTMAQHPRLAPFERCTRSIGLLYGFISLWIVSIFGNYGEIESYYRTSRMELFHWSLLFAAAAGISLWFGVKRDDAMLRGYGIVFLGINLYTRFFEHFWSSMHKSIFFILMGLSLWFLAHRIETIWNLGRQPKEKTEENQS